MSPHRTGSDDVGHMYREEAEVNLWKSLKVAL